MKERDFNDCRAVSDVKVVVEKLKLKAVGKIREFLLHKIFQFRRPMANYQMLQNQLLNYRYIVLYTNQHIIYVPLAPLIRYFNEFLMAHSRDIALQVRSEYIDTMTKVYFSYFKDYYSKLMKMQVCGVNSCHITPFTPFYSTCVVCSLRRWLRKMT